jgi:Zn-dependent protease
VDVLIQFLRVLLVILISITIHEFSHALMATWLGDDLPRYQGRLTLNPLAHLDPVGTLMIIISSLSGFGLGWGRPVQVNPVRLRHGPAIGMGIVAIAGPISNLLLALLAAALYHLTNFFGLLNESWFQFFLTFMLVNLGLAFFNLIPLFPLDGFRVALALLRLIRGPTAMNIAYRLESTVAYGPMLFLFVILADQVLRLNLLGTIIGTPASFVLRLLLGRV